MPRMIFINLPVRDLRASTDFYTGLGFQLNQTFSDRLVQLSRHLRHIFLMALHVDRFADFVAGPVGDPQHGTTVINCLSADSQAEVDLLVSRALSHGGQPWLDKMEDGPMYGHSFADPDGHAWEVLHMDIPTG